MPRCIKCLSENDSASEDRHWHRIVKQQHPKLTTNQAHYNPRPQEWRQVSPHWHPTISILWTELPTFLTFLHTHIGSAWTHTKEPWEVEEQKKTYTQICRETVATTFTSTPCMVFVVQVTRPPCSWIVFPTAPFMRRWLDEKGTGLGCATDAARCQAWCTAAPTPRTSAHLVMRRSILKIREHRELK